ncbi:hypothetical protein JZ751_024846 [Albula glossodonta]|uniref:Uncharacterized protein n=1 Tax=Albula glossodonta TaxID=121402 RepID=A0A8T2PMK4_9TELE|nr:hypothetical protein JZ751_024846 [Albula glossodonta]
MARLRTTVYSQHSAGKSTSQLHLDERPNNRMTLRFFKMKLCFQSLLLALENMRTRSEPVKVKET